MSYPTVTVGAQCPLAVNWSCLARAASAQTCLPCKLGLFKDYIVQCHRFGLSQRTSFDDGWQ